MTATLIASNNVRLWSHATKKDGSCTGLVAFKDEKILAEFITKIKKTGLKQLDKEVKKMSYGVATKIIAPTEALLRSTIKKIKKASAEIVAKELADKKAKEEKAVKKTEAPKKEEKAPKTKAPKK